jgi:hypothetical protein
MDRYLRVRGMAIADKCPFRVKNGQRDVFVRVVLSIFDWPKSNLIALRFLVRR